MRRSGFTRKLPGHISPPIVPLARPVRVAVIAEEVQGFPKDERWESERWLAAVRTLDCMRCFKAGPSDPAHRNEGKGKGLKTHDCWTAALCRECHREIDQGKTMTRAERREALDTAILMTLRALVKKGLVVAK